MGIHDMIAKAKEDGKVDVCKSMVFDLDEAIVAQKWVSVSSYKEFFDVLNILRKCGVIVYAQLNILSEKRVKEMIKESKDDLAYIRIATGYSTLSRKQHASEPKDNKTYTYDEFMDGTIEFQ